MKKCWQWKVTSCNGRPPYCSVGSQSKGILLESASPTQRFWSVQFRNKVTCIYSLSITHILCVSVTHPCCVSINQILCVLCREDAVLLTIPEDLTDRLQGTGRCWLLTLYFPHSCVFSHTHVLLPTLVCIFLHTFVLYLHLRALICFFSAMRFNSIYMSVLCCVGEGLWGIPRWGDSHCAKWTLV